MKKAKMAKAGLGKSVRRKGLQLKVKLNEVPYPTVEELTEDTDHLCQGHCCLRQAKVLIRFNRLGQVSYCWTCSPMGLVKPVGRDCERALLLTFHAERKGPAVATLRCLHHDLPQVMQAALTAGVPAMSLSRG